MEYIYFLLKRLFNYGCCIVILFSSCVNKNGQTEEGEKVNEENCTQTDKNASSSFVEPRNKQIPIFDECTNYDNRLSTVASAIHFVAIDSVMLLRDFFVNDIALSDEYIFLSSHDYIYQYDRNGKFVRKIGGKGMGPKEYVQLSSPLLLDCKQHLLYAIDEMRDRIMVYDFDGNLYKLIPVKEDYSCLALVDSTTFAVRTLYSDRFKANTLSLLLLDQEGKEKKAFKSYLYPISKSQMENFGPEENYLWNCYDKFYTLEYGNDTIFQVKNEELVPRLTLTGKLKLQKDELFKNNQGNKRSIVKPLHKPNAAIFESNQFIIFRIKEKKERSLLAYNKKTGEMHRTNRQKNIAKPEHTNDLNYSYYMDDLVSGMPFYPLYQSNGKAIAFLSATNVIENKPKILDYIQTHPSEEAKNLENIVNRLKEDDNSLLMIVEFK